MQIGRCVGVPKTTCKLFGAQKLWGNAPDVVITSLFGMYVCVYGCVYVSHACVHYGVFTTGKCTCCSMQDISEVLVTFTKANICGVEFTAGQDLSGGGSGRCGSVVTCVVGGQSVYGKVVKFFSRVCDSDSNSLFAFIEWFRMPEYPMDGTPLVVRVRDNGPECLAPSVMSIFDIDPSRVITERDDSENSYYMCRVEGLDTIQ